jgi:hypothetical protein
MSQTSRDIALAVYADSGREVTQNFTTMYSNISLASGLLAAVLAVLGAGELFSDTTTTTKGLPDLSPISLIILCLAFPLLLRALVRSMLGYNNLLRYNKIRAVAWGYLSGSGSWVDFYATHEVYQTKWRAPEAVGKSIRSNMKYGFAWLFFVFATATGWAFYTANGGYKFKLTAGAILLLGLAWESINLARSSKSYFTLPTDADWTAARAGCPAEVTSSGQEGPPDRAASATRKPRGLYWGRF